MFQVCAESTPGMFERQAGHVHVMLIISAVQCWQCCSAILQGTGSVTLVNSCLQPHTFKNETYIPLCRKMLLGRLQSRQQTASLVCCAWSSINPTWTRKQGMLAGGGTKLAVADISGAAHLRQLAA